MNVTLGPAIVSKPFETPVNKNITFWSVLVEMNKSSRTESSPYGFWFIIMYVMRWLIKANGMATFGGERNSFVVAWVESGDIIVINPHELISLINISNLVPFFITALKPESLVPIIDETHLWCIKVLLILFPVFTIPGASRAFGLVIRFNDEDVEYCVVMLSVGVDSLKGDLSLTSPTI